MTIEGRGKRCWMVLSDLSESGEIIVMSDDFMVRDDGTLLLCVGEEATSVFAPGKWHGIFAASCIDWHPIDAVHWPGQIVES